MADSEAMGAVSCRCAATRRRRKMRAIMARRTRRRRAAKPPPRRMRSLARPLTAGSWVAEDVVVGSRGDPMVVFVGAGRMMMVGMAAAMV